LSNPAEDEVRAESLQRLYGSGRGIDGVTFSVAQGECFCLLGRNGSGKSTLTRLLLGMDQPTGGMLKVLGRSPGGRQRRAHLSRIGSVTDTSVHWEQLSGWENAYFVARTYRLPRAKIEKRLTDLFMLADLRSQALDAVASYSFGMRRKLSLIQALCHDPPLLVLDEPTAGVDPQFLLRLADLVRARSGEKKTTWIASNDPDWAAAVADSAAFLDAGKICAAGSLKDLLGEVSPLREIRITLSIPHPVGTPQMSGIRSFEQSGKKITALLGRDPALIPKTIEWILSMGGLVERLEVKESGLKDAFLLKTGRVLQE
jgi:ABC-type multidrug transport system ATPase subunit